MTGVRECHRQIQVEFLRWNKNKGNEILRLSVSSFTTYDCQTLKPVKGYLNAGEALLIQGTVKKVICLFPLQAAEGWGGGCALLVKSS